MDADLESNLSVNGVGGEDGLLLLILTLDTDGSIDGETRAAATRRPNCGGEWDFVVEEVILVERARDPGLSRHLLGLTGEVVESLLVTAQLSAFETLGYMHHLPSITLSDISVSTVIR